MHALKILQHLASCGAIPRSRVKDIKTALNKLANAYQLPLDELDLASIEPTYADALKTFFAELRPPASEHTERNTYQNLAQLYRQAHATSLLRTSVRPRQTHLLRYKSIQKDMRASSPYRTHYAGKAWVRYAVPPEQWPAEIRQNWQAYVALRAIEIRQATLKHYTEIFSQYMGYNLRYEQPPVERWEQLFETSRLLRCVSWLADRVGAERISRHGFAVVILLVDIAKHLERPEYAALQKLKYRLPKPSKVYDKKLPRHTVSLSELDRLGLTLMQEARRVRQGSREVNGSRRASKFATGLTIRLLVRCPRRAREVLEMDLGERLYRDDRGTWQLHYRSHQLKIAEHDGQLNEFRSIWPPDLVDDLEEYLRDYRPILLGRSTSAVVFPSYHGVKMSRSALQDRIKLACWDRLGKHVFPHLFRTLWCDAYLDAHPGDFEGAAAMLNDTPETVQGWYRQFRVQQHLKKAMDFNAQIFGNGHGKEISR